MKEINLPLILFVLILIFVVEFYTFQGFKSVLKTFKLDSQTMWVIAYWTLSTLFIISFLFFPKMRTIEHQPKLKNIYIFFVMGYAITKLLIGSFMFLADIVQLITYFIQKSTTTSAQIKGQSFTRSGFISTMIYGAGALLFTNLLWGTRNKYNYKIHKKSFGFKNLPNPISRLKIIQISDIHSGSFDNIECLKHGIDLINAQQPDIVFFTGDLVNNKSDEIDPFISVFREIKAKYGVFSILGNHDYGDYQPWNSKEEKVKDFEKFIQKHKMLNWKLLRNENVVLDIEGHKLGVIGVENWSKSSRFPKYGDLKKAMQDMPSTDFNILLSHDPSHWKEQILPTTNIPLTLSGHTHGMQMGVEIGNFKWSPSKYLYPEWAGSYEENNRYIYVNRGFGFLGYPGRMGILPEISVLTLG